MFAAPRAATPNRDRNAAAIAPGLPFAIAAQLAYPDRQSVAIVGDGGFAMLMAELSTAVAQSLPVKIILLKNNSLAEGKFEQKEMATPTMAAICLQSTSWRFGKACSAKAFHCERPDEIRPAIRSALSSPGPALVEAVVDPDEKPPSLGRVEGLISEVSWGRCPQ